MIKIDDKYFITADNCQYVLRKKGAINKKGEETDSIMGYYSNVPNALAGFIRNAERENIADDTIKTITDLIKFHNEAKETVKRLLKEVSE
jgi:hypothetical protein